MLEAYHQYAKETEEYDGHDDIALQVRLGYFSGDKLVVLQCWCGHSDDGHCIVGEVGQDREPDAPAPIEQVSKICPQYHAGQESIELQVERAEKDGGYPDDCMMIQPKPAQRLA